MDFQLLGPIRVLDRGTDLTPVRPKQRALLAMLLLHREQVVPGAQLIEAVWSGAPPGSAQSALHGHVSSLRKLLGADRVRTRPPGYLLRVAPDELDVDRFESLLAEARRRGDPEERATRLREALGLWRGEPLADLRYAAFAQAEIARLEELRLAALEDRIDADLALGREHELIAELEPLVVEHPFRERLRAQLMLALYRCGRQADALHVFQSGRTALVDELGIEPGPALQQLERSILNQDPALDRPVGRLERGEHGEERKVATILFADVIGSTEPGARLDPERLRALLRTYSEAMSDVITSWGGTLETYIGDAIVAVFGVPAVHEDDAERAIRAALDMLERLEELNRDFAARHGIRLAIRIGINTGEVIAPAADGRGRLVAGDAVNVAARLEEAAEPGTVLVGARTYASVRRSFRFDDPLALDVKGKRETVTAHLLRGALPAAGARSRVREAPLVGRDRELSRLVDELEAAFGDGTPRFVLLSGPAGIGKSRLTREFLAAARDRQPDLSVLIGRCVAAGRGIMYWALCEILCQVCGISRDDSADVASRRLVAGARETLAALALADDDVVRTVFALAVTAGIAVPDNPLDQLEPRAVADELTRAWPRFTTALARRRPTIIVIEDLHWAGEPLVEMVERLIARADGPLFLLATARSEFAEAQPGFPTRRDGATSLSVQPLSAAQSADLVEGLLEVAELPAELHREIVRIAEGNPFFLEEIVLRLIDVGAIVPEDGGWRVERPVERIGIPDTVHGVLAARIDALPAEEKSLLQEAAVIGRRFWQEPLVRTLGDFDVGAALLRLEARGLVTARPTSSLRGQAEYQFKHALVRDVAYAGLPKARRARAHADHALWIEQLAGDRRDELVELIAAHYRSALAGDGADLAWADDEAGWERVRGRGFDAFLDAGAAARRRFAIERALELHDEALALAAGDLERGKALAAIGDDHEAAYHGDEAFAAYAPALEALRGERGAEQLRARICLMAGRMAAVKWGGFRTKPTPAAMERFLDEGLELAVDDETRNWLTVLKGNVGLRWAWSGLDDPLPIEARIEAAARGVEAAEQLDLPDLLSQAYRTYGLLQSAVGRWDRTQEIARRDLRLADRLERTEQAFALFWNATFLMEIAGEFPQHVGDARRAVEVARGLTPHEVMHGTCTLMNALYHLGRWTELSDVAGEHLDALATEPGIGCPYVRAGPLFAALALAHQGRIRDADRLAATLTPDLDSPKLPEALLARFLVARGDPRAGQELAGRILGRTIYAEENAYEVLAMLEALVALEDWDALAAFLPQARSYSEALALVAPACDRAEGLARAAGAERDAAEALLRRASRRFAAMGVVFEAALTDEALAGVVEHAEAARLRADALEAYASLGAVPHAERLQARLASVAGS